MEWEEIIIVINGYEDYTVYDDGLIIYSCEYASEALRRNTKKEIEKVIKILEDAIEKIRKHYYGAEKKCQEKA